MRPRIASEAGHVASGSAELPRCALDVSLPNNWRSILRGSGADFLGCVLSFLAELK
jgi:hypothetical protein